MLALLAVLVVVIAALTGAPTAQAADCAPVLQADGTLVYPCSEPGGGSTPTCTLTGLATFCIGLQGCWYERWEPPSAEPMGPKPGPTSKEQVRTCLFPVGTGNSMPVWVGGGVPPPPPLIDQARTIIGKLTVTTGALRSSPQGRSIVGISTWWWLDGLSSATLRGSSAFGLVAVAVPAGMDVDPGDGSPAVHCPFTATAEQAQATCTTTYRRSSGSGSARVAGQPVFAASVTATWDVRFELAGAPVTIPGAPTTISSPVARADLAVAEVQSIVDGTG